MISVIGDGGWGTTLAVYLVKRGYAVKLWGPFPEYVRQMRQNRYNPRFLPGVILPPDLELVETLSGALQDSDLVVFAIPSQYATKVLRQIKQTRVNFSKKIFLSVTKGIDRTSLLRISQIIRQELGKIPLAVLSGPTISTEVAQGIASTAVIAARDIRTAKQVQDVFNSDTFRIYTNTDVVGVEVGGSIKNIIAIACGVCDGLKLGTNTKAAIVTRGLAEMARLGKALGARPQTFSGLTGLGDLVTTCFSPQSRNRYVGEQLGLGKSARAIIGGMEMVAEGVETVKAVFRLSRKLKVSMPITSEVFRIIYQHKKPAAALADLMSRKARPE
ncbi:MAG: NAD(P)-dependent glycerol-3-phosphate dehydrogenase [Candidatus Omnitrophica bacterium]|nr:NAD(P)-dependent glycerol-3-phosphate dehydrogenase [Candidatus Omnitrophota bacterium]